MGWSVSSVLELAYLEWKKGSRPDWSDALPFYGQHPVKGMGIGIGIISFQLNQLVKCVFFDRARCALIPMPVICL